MTGDIFFDLKTVLLTGFKNIFTITTSIIRTKAATEVYAVLFSNITCWYSHICLPYNTFNRNHVNYDNQVFRVQSFLQNLNESFSYLKMPLHLQNIIIWTKFATSGEFVIIILFYGKVQFSTEIFRTQKYDGQVRMFREIRVFCGLPVIALFSTILAFI